MHFSNLSRETFVQYFSALYEHSSWVIERTWQAGLALKHDDPQVLFKQFAQVCDAATQGEKLALLRSYPDLAGKAAGTGLVSREFSAEHQQAGLDQCSPEQLARFNTLNRLYWARFGFPFITLLSSRTPDDILDEFSKRLRVERDVEFSTAVAEVQKIAQQRLDTLVQHHETQSKALTVPVEQMGVLPVMSGGVQSQNFISPASVGGMSAAQMRDPDYFPGIARGLPLGIQHVLAMFVSNVTPAIIVAGAVGFGFGSADTSSMIYLIQMSMLFAGIATLIQTISLGPVGARLPIVQGTSFAFIPVMIPIAIEFGMAALMGGIIIGGIFHFFVGTLMRHIRHWLPPLVTGLVVLMIGLALVKVGVQYAAGGVPMIGHAEYGSFSQWSLALLVIAVTLGLKFFASGMLSVSAVLLGLLAGYAVAVYQGMVTFNGVHAAAWFALPDPLHFGFEVNTAAVVGMCLMGLISAIETVGDISGITKAGAGREASDREVAGGTMADGLGTAIAGVFGALPNTSFSQNVGLISMTGVMSRHVVTLGALFLIVCGFVPKVGAAIQTMPIAVLGGGVIVMFGMVTAAGVNILSSVRWNRRNMLIFGTALSIGLGLQLEPDALQHLPATVKVLMSSGLLPAAFIAVVLNGLLPDEDERGVSIVMKDEYDVQVPSLPQSSVIAAKVGI